MFANYRHCHLHSQTHDHHTTDAALLQRNCTHTTPAALHHCVCNPLDHLCGSSTYQRSPMCRMQRPRDHTALLQPGTRALGGPLHEDSGPKSRRKQAYALSSVQPRQHTISAAQLASQRSCGCILSLGDITASCYLLHFSTQCSNSTAFTMAAAPARDLQATPQQQTTPLSRMARQQDPSAAGPSNPH
jgi:hypothetical protein